MGNKIANLGMDKKPAATAPTPGGGSYTGPTGINAGGAGMDAASMDAAPAGNGANGSGFDRYGRNFAASAGASGDVDLNTINQIIANLEGGAAPAPAPAPALALAPAPPPSALASAGQPAAPSGLGLGGTAVSRAAIAHMDDDARLAAAIAASLGEASAPAAAATAPQTIPAISGKSFCKSRLYSHCILFIW